MRESNQLLRNLHSYCEQTLYEGDKQTAFAKYHLINRRDPNYQETLLESFNELLQEDNFDIFLEMGTHLAYLQEMDVDLSLPLRRIQEDIVGKFLSCLDGSISISNAKEILSVLGKLVTHSQCCDLITKNIETTY